MRLRTYVPDEHSISYSAPVGVAVELLEAMDGHDPLGHLERLATAGSFVSALAADLDRRVGRRALPDLTGRQLDVRRRDLAGLRDLAIAIAGGRDGAEPGSHPVASCEAP